MPQIEPSRWTERTTALPTKIPSNNGRTLKDLKVLLGDHVLLKNIKPSNMTKSGLHIPEQAQREDFEMYQAEVVATGPGTTSKYGKFNPMQVKPGDRVLVYFIAMTAGVTNWPSEGHLIIDQRYIQAVLED